MRKLSSSTKSPIRISILAAAVLLTGLPCTAVAQSQSVRSGKLIYNQYCSSCHGVDARGTGPVGKALALKPANLRELAKNNDGKFPILKVAEYIDGREEIPAHGTRQMPVWGRQFGEMVGGGSIGEEVTRGKIHVLVEYLKSIQD